VTSLEHTQQEDIARWLVVAVVVVDDIAVWGRVRNSSR